MITFADNYELVQALAITLHNLERDHPHALVYEKSLVAAALQQVTTSLTREFLNGRDVFTPPFGVNGQIMISGELETIIKQR